MDNYPIDQALQDSEDSFSIDLLNKTTGVVFPDVAVYGQNTCGQVMKEYAEDIGIDPARSKHIFTNKRTSNEASDLNTTLDNLGMKNGDVLVFSDEGSVA